jgi:hypothetical protein
MQKKESLGQFANLTKNPSMASHSFYQDSSMVNYASSPTLRLGTPFLKAKNDPLGDEK